MLTGARSPGPGLRDAAEAFRTAGPCGGSGRGLRLLVVDDGRGGADPTRGTGLRGIARRLAAFAGVLHVSSPVGGPTTVAAKLPWTS